MKNWRALPLTIAIAACLAGNARVESKQPETILLPIHDLFPESITSGPDGTLYVGSAGRGGILRIRQGSSKIETFVESGTQGSRSIFGVAVDPLANRLLACSNDLAAFGIESPAGAPGAALLILDLSTGRLEKRVPLPGAVALCNDIAIGPDGAIYVTNSAAPQVLRLAPGGDELVPWASDPRFQPPFGGGLDGISFDRHGTAYVSVFQTGDIFSIASGPNGRADIRKVALSRQLSMPDAIHFDSRGDLLIVEGGGKLSRARITRDGATIITERDGLDGPTGVTLSGDHAWIIEGHIGYLMAPDLRGKTPPAPFRIIALHMSGSPKAR